MIKNKCLLIGFLLLLSLSGCHWGKGKINEREFTAEEQLINQHYYESNVQLLLDDCSKYPKYKDYIYGLIFVDLDLSFYSHDELVCLRDISSDLKIKESFDALIKDKEINDIIGSFGKNNPDTVAYCYKHGNINKDLFNNYIENCFVKNIDKFSYQEIKHLNNCFSFTPFYVTFHEKYLKMKESASGKIEKDVNDYLLKENLALNQLHTSLNNEVLTYISNRWPFIKNAVLARGIPNNKKEIKEMINKIVTDNISLEYIDSICSNNIELYTDDINDARIALIESLGVNATTHELANSTAYHDIYQKIETDNKKLSRHNVRKVISNVIKNVPAALSAFNDAKSFFDDSDDYDYYGYDYTSTSTLDVICNISDLLDVEGFLEAKASEYQNNDEINSKLKFVESLQSQLNSFGKNYSELMFTYYKENVKLTQEQFKKTYYELY